MFDQLEDARRDAERVLTSLEATTARFLALPADHPHRLHGFFSELYVCSASNWLDLLSGQRDCTYQYRFIVEFFALYRRFVLDELDTPLEEIVPHWRPYHRLARHLSLSSPISWHLLLLSAAVRAHLRFDQGIAMCSVEEGLGLGETAARPHRQRLFGPVSDMALTQTALDYVLRQKQVHAGWRRLTLEAYQLGLHALRPIWLPTAQSWRRKGFDEARKSARDDLALV